MCSIVVVVVRTVMLDWFASCIFVKTCWLEIFKRKSVKDLRRSKSERTVLHAQRQSYYTTKYYDTVIYLDLKTALVLKTKNQQLFQYLF